jgi:hypothetical protein
LLDVLHHVKRIRWRDYVQIANTRPGLIKTFICEINLISYFGQFYWGYLGRDTESLLSNFFQNNKLSKRWDCFFLTKRESRCASLHNCVPLRILSV